MSLVAKLQPIKARHTELADALGQAGLDPKELVKLSTEYAGLDPVVTAINTYEEALQEQDDLSEMMEDPAMKEMAEADMLRLSKEIPELEEQIKLALIPKDVADTKNAILEIRAGTGGDEAALFAADLQIYLVCIKGMHPSKAGSLRLWKHQRAMLADIVRLLLKSPERMCLRSSNLNRVFTAFSACPRQKHKGVCIRRRQLWRFCPKPKTLM